MKKVCVCPDCKVYLKAVAEEVMGETFINYVCPKCNNSWVLVKGSVWNDVWENHMKFLSTSPNEDNKTKRG